MKKILKDVHEFMKGSVAFSYNGFCSDTYIYPLNLEFTIVDTDFYYKYLDENGVPYRVYSSMGKQYNPTRIAAYGLAHYNNYIENQSEDSKKKFLSMVEWFLSKESGLYFYDFDWDDLKAPWISCMAQGEAASLLIRAYKTTGDCIYLDHASKSLEPLFLDIVKGGVKSFINNKHVFLEEYPGSKNLHVLNGFLFGLIGIIETRLITNDEKLKSLEQKLVYSLVENLDKWGESWSYYQIDAGKILKNFCTPAYHNLHISQLKFINEHHPDWRLEEKIDSWSEGSLSLSSRLAALGGKVAYRVINKAQR